MTKNNKEFDWNKPHSRHEIFQAIFEETEKIRINDEKEFKLNKETEKNQTLLL